MGVYESPTLLTDMICRLSAESVDDCHAGGIGASVLRALRMLRFAKLLGKYPVIQVRQREARGSLQGAGRRARYQAGEPDICQW